MNVFSECNFHMGNQQRKTRFSLPAIRYATIAAIFTLAVAVSSYWLIFRQRTPENYAQTTINKINIIRTAFSEMREIMLPDGTKVHVNGGTEIDYDKNQFDLEKREIWLAGEAFFEVAKNPDKPFIIHTGNIITTVRGTSFNVKAYDQMDKISVVVRSGIVEVGMADRTFDVLTANKQIIYDETTDQYTTSESSWEDAGAWMHKRLVLKDAGIEEFNLRLQQLYGVTLIDHEGLLKNSLLNASYEREASLENVLTGICEAYEIHYSVDVSGRTISLYQNDKEKK